MTNNNKTSAPMPAPRAIRELASARDPAAAHVLHHDIETRSTIDLPTVGTVKYASDPTTEVLCLCYAVDDEPAQLWVPDDPVPSEFIEAANNPNWLLAAHNDEFERSIAQHILEPRHGFPVIPIERRRCSMAMAYAAALPGKLEKVVNALDLPHEKDKAGKALMLRMTKPLPGGGWIEDTASLERLYAYCRQDVEAERAVYKAVPSLTANEQTLWQLDVRINARGFAVDVPLLEAAHRVVTETEAKLQAEFRELTGLNSTNQTEKFIAWLGAHDCAVTDIQKSTLKHALRRKGLAPDVRRAIELRLQLAHASAAKIEALLAWRGADNRVRGALVFHGASTGRWTARGPQPQNFRRDSDGIDAKIAGIMNGGADLASPVEVVGDVARATIVAAPGHRFLIGDFSGIESRVLAYVSGQVSKLKEWAKYDLTGALTDDPYYILGRACGLAEDIARANGKICDLAFGFQGGLGAWKAQAPDDDPSTDDDIERYKQNWRARHPHTVAFWNGVNNNAIAAVRAPDKEFTYKRLRFACDGKFLRITLPSGRALSYPFPRIEIGAKYGDPRVVFKDASMGKWSDCRFGQGAYGGMWTENVVQALARDLLAGAMQRLEAAAYRVTLTVHDEVVAEVPDGFGNLEEFRHLLTALPDWVTGLHLPIAAKVRESARFCRPDNGSAVADSSEPKSEPEPDDAEPDTRADPDELAALLGDGDDDGGDHPDDRDRDEVEEDFGTADLMAGAGVEAAPAGAGDRRDVGAVLALVQQADDCDRIGEQQNSGTRNSADANTTAIGGNGHDGYPHGERDTGRQVAFFVYRHADGSPYLAVKKTSTKQFPQYHWTGSAWALGAPSGLKIPYRLPELIRAPRDAWVLICAGEKDAETAARLGFMTTTNSEGERKGAWAPELNTWFAGRKRVAIMEDNDETGRAHVIEVATALRGIVPDIRIVTFHDLPEHGDLTDWIERGHGHDDLLAKLEAAKPADGDFSTVPLTIDEWLSRDLPPLDPLIGNVLSTTTRALLAAPTGIGKTNFGMALWAHAGFGKNFLHWHVPRPCRMLFIDGEMSRRLLRERIEAMTQHLGGKPECALFFNKEDIEDFAPLNTSEGQAAVWKLIEEVERRLGAPLDAISFDNIVSLIIGDMKEEDAWRDTMPLVRALTKRRIGQLWLHHTGHDTSRGYGTKTREWQLDLVMHMTEVKRPDADVSFTLSFPKARERTPDNRGDFTEVNIALVDNRWISEMATSGKEKPAPLARRFFEALQTAAHNSSLTHINGYPIATLDEWQAQCVASGLIDPTAKPDAARSLFSKYKLQLIAANWIAANTEAAWILP